MCRSSRSGTARTRSSRLGPRLQGAKWNLDKTIVRAPADGSSPTWRCAGVDVLPRWCCRRPSSTHRRRSTVSRSADHRRPCQVGQSVQITFNYLLGRIFPGKVETDRQAVSGRPTQVSGQAVTP